MNGALQSQMSKEGESDNNTKPKTKQMAQNEANEEVKTNRQVSSNNLPVSNKLGKDSKKINQIPKNPNDLKKVEQVEPSELKSEEIHNEIETPIMESSKSAEHFQNYLNTTGISLAFQIIFAEIIQKQIPKDKVFSYTSKRLKQIGSDLQDIKSHRL